MSSSHARVPALARRVFPAGLLLLLLGSAVLIQGSTSYAQPEECLPYASDTFPRGTVWWKVDPARAEQTGLAEKPEGNAAYLILAVRPDGILIQNRESRYPRLLSWKRLTQNLISTDGRRTWRRGCAG